MGKIKQFIDLSVQSEKGKDILTVIIVILVGLGSFGLGRLSKAPQAGLKIEYPDQDPNGEANVISSVESSSLLQKTEIEKSAPGKTFFASSRGSRYYSIGCSAGKNIKQENRVWFANREEAERAGYELSSSCR